MILSEKIVGGKHFLHFKDDMLIPMDRIIWIDLMDPNENGLVGAAIHLQNPEQLFSFEGEDAETVRSFFNKGYWKD